MSTFVVERGRRGKPAEPLIEWLRPKPQENCRGRTIRTMTHFWQRSHTPNLPPCWSEEETAKKRPRHIIFWTFVTLCQNFRSSSAATKHPVINDTENAQNEIVVSPRIQSSQQQQFIHISGPSSSWPWLCDSSHGRHTQGNGRSQTIHKPIRVDRREVAVGGSGLLVVRLVPFPLLLCGLFLLFAGGMLFVTCWCCGQRKGNVSSFQFPSFLPSPSLLGGVCVAAGTFFASPGSSSSSSSIKSRRPLCRSIPSCRVTCSH
jgi:hypothetical protein